MKLRDRVALITGGTAGIGQAIAIRYASEGAKIAVVASTNIGKAERVAHQITEAGGVARPFVADVSKVDEIGSMVEAVVAAFGDVHILVNSAGIVGGTPAGATSEADYDRVMDTNLKGTFFCANAVVPLMKAKGSGHIVNISGIGAFRGSSGGAAYCASKAGVLSVTEALANELAPHGIHVNAIAPGSTMSENVLKRTNWSGGGPEITRATRALKRDETPEDLIGACVFLASSDSDFITGQTLVVDGGSAMW